MSSVYGLARPIAAWLNSIVRQEMSSFTKILVVSIVVLFSVSGIGALIFSGAAQQSASYFVVSAIVAFLGAVGLFFQRYPPPPLVPGEGNSAWALLKSYRKKYPGWQSRLIGYSIPVLVLLALLSRLLDFFSTLHTGS